MRHLWNLKIDWDQDVPEETHVLWTNYVKQLTELNNLAIPRMTIVANAVDIQLHGFCDASEQAYGACIYLLSTNGKNETISHLVCAKSRVAPIKSVSIPRLELCAAVLLAKLYKITSAALELTFSKTRFWSDSTIVLHWINTSPHLLKTFVANRVTDITETTKPEDWAHVPSKQNPADLLSRGLSASELSHNSMWYNGPDWLILDENEWPQVELQLQQIPELKSTVNLLVNTSEFNLLTRFSTLTKLTRVTAYCLRYIHNLKNSIKKSGPLSTTELSSARTRIIILTQREEFARDIHELNKEGQVHKKSKILSLSPFIDSEGILRVGGRLRQARITYDMKHPILLPRKHHVTLLIIQGEHIRHWHAGAQATLYAIRQHYWIIDGRNTIRRIIHDCIKCYRTKPQEIDYLMGDLPKNRLTSSRPFLNCGVDYCGPFFIKEKRHRNRNKLKIYIAIFVCFVTKAVHIEVVSDLTSEAFIACLKRFIARRGKCDHIYSDNGTNFIGANRELSEIHELLTSQAHNLLIQQVLAEQRITWHFIPPRSPHFGGLWEAAVKSFKAHLLRTVGDTLFTYEQMHTYVTEVEAILNSRPLTPLSSDPNDLIALTPGHFLIGDSLMSISEHDFTDTPSNKLSAWQHIQKVRQHFWSRWHKEYLNELNVRSKWQTEASNIKIGTMVLLREDNTPPMHWPLGRIVDIHPGPDKVTRVVSVRTSSGVYKRSVKRVSPLPIHN